jgi:regulator of protease activity HflC (stomatin/prohibitin superfamily)
MLLSMIFFVGCERVEQGYRGAKVHLLGDEKGAIEEKGPGYYFYNRWTHDVIDFPVHVQRYAYVANKNEETNKDQSIRATSNDNLEFSVGVALQYRVNPIPGCVTRVYRTYKNDNFRALSQGPVRDIVRDQVHNVYSQYEAGEIYGDKRPTVMDQVTSAVEAEFDRIASIERGGERHSCLVVSNLGLAELDAPRAVKQAVERKMKAAQRALEEKAKLRQQRFASQKDSVKAAQDAENNRMIAESITPELLQYMAMQAWDGKLPKVTGNGEGVMLDMKSLR